MSQLATRQLGSSALNVPVLTVGGNVFGWTVDEATSFTLLDALFERGFTFIDTADMYSNWAPGNRGGESETIIGNWLKKKGCRHKIVLATKVGMEMAPGKTGLSAGYIRQSVEDSLRRLQTDYIDLYQAHRDDEDTPLAQTLSTFDALIREGKVRAIGASNYRAARLEEALAVSKENHLAAYVSLQPQYNLYDRQGYESELEKVVLDNHLGVINYYALASGFLSGKYRCKEDAGKSLRGAGVVETYLNARGLRILDALDAVAKECDATPGQVVLAWLIARPGITAPIVSATSVAQVDELAKAARLTLNAAAIDRLNEASAEG